QLLLQRRGEVLARHGATPGGCGPVPPPFYPPRRPGVRIGVSYPPASLPRYTAMRSLLAGLVLLLPLPLRADEPPPLRAGIIGLDPSHVVAFTALLNGPKAEGALKGVRVVAAYPGGSPDLPASRDRVAGYTKTLRDKYHVEIVGSI